MSQHSPVDNANKRILCVGMCVLDIIHVCEDYPVEDTDKRCLTGYWQRGGNASNNCTVLRQLGAQCEFLGMLSDALAFGFLQADCKQRGIVIENCPHVPHDPPFSSVILVKSSDTRTIIHSNPNFPILTWQHFSRIDLANYHWIHFEARNPEETLKMLQAIYAYNQNQQNEAALVKVSIDMEKLKLGNMTLCAWVDYIFLGKDLAQYLGWQNAEGAVFGFSQMLHSLSDMQRTKKKPVIICPWGAQGSSCLDGLNNHIHVAAAPPAQIIDALGAGDTFCAATIYALSLLRMNLEQALNFGNRCAGFKLGARGYDVIAKFQQQEKE